MNGKDENAILDGFISGNDPILKELYSDLFPKVRNFVLKNSGSDTEAKDIFQDALVFTYQKLKSGSLKLECTLATYVFAVSKNLWRNVLRKKRGTIAFDVAHTIPEAMEQDIESTLERKDRVFLFQKHFLKLSTTCKDLLASFFSGKSMSEIATAMGYSEGYTRKKKFVCKQKLLEMIEADPTFSELSLSPNNAAIK